MRKLFFLSALSLLALAFPFGIGKVSGRSEATHELFLRESKEISEDALGVHEDARLRASLSPAIPHDAAFVQISFYREGSKGSYLDTREEKFALNEAGFGEVVVTDVNHSTLTEATLFLADLDEETGEIVTVLYGATLTFSASPVDGGFEAHLVTGADLDDDGWGKILGEFYSRGNMHFVADCDLNNAVVHPGPTAFVEEPFASVGFDVNCDGREELLYTGTCYIADKPGEFSVSGFGSDIPRCGEEAEYFIPQNGACISIGMRRQACR